MGPARWHVSRSCADCELEKFCLRGGFFLYLAIALERYLTRTLSTIDVRVDAAADLRAEMWGSLTRMDRLLIRKDGTMRVKDEHLNIVARWLYPVAVAC